MLARLMEFREIAPLVRHFVFEAEGQTLKFLPGQFVSFVANVGGKEITRAYSLASAPGPGNRFELCLNVVPEGKLTPHLFAMQPGDTISMSEPLGTFTLRNPSREAVMVATGTGITPFRSILHSHLGSQSPRTTLLFGVRHEANLLYRSEFERLDRQFPPFSFWPVLSRPETSWKGRVGHVQAHLEEAISGRRDVDFYLCGLKQMVDDVRLILKTSGFDRKQIFYEKYD